MIQSAKSEARNPKSETSPNDRNRKSRASNSRFGTFRFGASDLFRISSFRFRISTLICFCPLLLAVGCQQPMGEQPSCRPLKPSSFFGDGQSARPLVAGTVARGQLRLDRAFYTGELGPAQGGTPMDAAGGGISLHVARTALAEKPYVRQFPFRVTREVLQRGQERFTIYCSVCHGPLGYGDGKVVQRGFTQPPSYHTDRLRDAPVGYFFDVITRGFGSMPDYAPQVPPGDRWAIVTYLRALQLSQCASMKDLDQLPEEVKGAALLELEKPGGQ
jgi:mono/diheme cytochrome c family protein